MGQLTRPGRPIVVALLALALALGAAGCGAGGSDKDAKKEEAKPIKTVRWPRFWATTDTAETGSGDAEGTAYFAGYDDDSVVYTGQDVVRFLDRETGKQRKRKLVKGNGINCASQPRRVIENGQVLLAVGAAGYHKCERLYALDSRTGEVKWDYGMPEGAGGAMTIDQRDGIVMFAMNNWLAALDAKTGKELWRHPSSEYFFGRPRPHAERCFINPALAADRAVIIAFLGCDDYSDAERQPGLYGIDLKTGKKLWHTAFWDEETEDSALELGGEEVRPHMDDGRTVLGSQANSAVRVDSSTGKVRPFPEPDATKLGSDEDRFSACNDFRTDEGLQHGDACAFTNGEQLVYALDLSARTRTELRIEGVDAESGKSLWVWQKEEGFQPGAKILGLNADRDEFWVTPNGTDVLRLDVKTGKRVGQGLAAPPLALVNFAIPGPSFLLTRGVGGINGEEAGLNFYKTDAK